MYAGYTFLHACTTTTTTATTITTTATTTNNHNHDGDDDDNDNNDNDNQLHFHAARVGSARGGRITSPSTHCWFKTTSALFRMAFSWRPGAPGPRDP